MRGKDQHPRCRCHPEDLASCLKAVQHRHGNVHHDDRGMTLQRQRNGFTPGPRLAHNFNVPFGFHQHPQAFANDDVIIGEENRDFLHHTKA